MTEQIERAFVVPVKGFSKAKGRLSPTLSESERSSLALRMANTVLAAAKTVPVVVACNDLEVYQWAINAGAAVAWMDRGGLNHAVKQSVKLLRDKGVAQVAVVPSDLPLVKDLTWVFETGGITLVPDSAFDGTNLCCLPAAVDFSFSYGPGSFYRHCLSARALEIDLRIVCDPELATDIDVTYDLLGWIDSDPQSPLAYLQSALAESSAQGGKVRRHPSTGHQRTDSSVAQRPIRKARATLGGEDNEFHH